ncbi:MAG: DUF3344 domain-containing protein [Candidatus Helarchaeota archaeon]
MVVALDARTRWAMLIIFTILLFQFTIFPSQSLYRFDGYPISWLVHGKIHGNLFIDGGHGLDATPYIEQFDIPSGENITFAGLFIGVWGGTEYQAGWIEAYINGSSLQRQDITGTTDVNPNIFGAAHGVYLVYYNVTTYLELDSLAVVTVNTGGAYDGRVYGLVLVVVFGLSNTTIKFCLGYGNVGLHYLIQGQSYNSFSFTFKDTYEAAVFSNATLYVSYLATSAGESDYLYFNDHLLDSNAADESSGWYFDLDTYPFPTSYLTTSNTVKFERGAESYLHPILAILKATYKNGEDGGADYINFNFEPPSGETNFNWLYIEVPAISLIVVAVFFYQYKRKKRIT